MPYFSSDCGATSYGSCLVAQPYNVITQPTSLPLTLEEVKEHLRLSLTDTSQDDYLTLLLKAAVTYGENYTKRTFINTTFLTYLSDFCIAIELRRSKAQSVEFIKYLVNDVLTLVDSDVYYLTNENAFAHIFLVDGEIYPTDADVNAQAVQIQFVAGYGADATFVPDELKLALLNHIAAMYEKRGDCSKAGASSTSMFLPALSKEIYDQFRIEDISSERMCC